MTSALRIGTRRSELALWQARTVGESLGVPYELVPLSTHGDVDLSSPLSAIGGQGVFVKEIQAALLRREVDLAVHSAKDLPSAEVDGLAISAFLARGDVRDALVGAGFDNLGPGAIVATGSARRRALLLRRRPDLEVVQLRGNIRTRLERRQGADAVVVAYAALERLGLAEMADEVMEPSEFCPQVAQGAIAVETRKDDVRALEAVAAMDHVPTRAEVTAERAMLAQIGSGCALPLGSYARWNNGDVEIYGMICSLDGSRIVESREAGADPVAIGTSLGRALLDGGGSVLLADVGASEAGDRAD